MSLKRFSVLLCLQLFLSLSVHSQDVIYLDEQSLSNNKYSLAFDLVFADGFEGDVIFADGFDGDDTNNPPVIESLAPAVAYLYETYDYQVIATDVDGDQLSYQLLEGPAGAVQDSSTGLIEWSVNDADYSSGISAANNQCLLSASQLGEQSQVELVTLMDGSGSMYEEQIFIGLWLPSLYGELLGLGLGGEAGIDVGLVEFGDQAILIETDEGEVLADIDTFANLMFPISSVQGNEGGNENGVRAMHTALDEYPFSDYSSRVFILMTDEPCQSCVSNPEQTEFLKERLIQTHTVVHSIGYFSPIKCPDDSIAMGIDADGVGYVADGNGGFSRCADAHISSTAGNSYIHYAEPALVSGGSAWQINTITSDDLTRQSFAQALAFAVGHITAEQTSLINRADLALGQVELTDQLQLTVINRGLSISGAAQVLLKKAGEVINNHALEPIPVGESTIVNFDVVDITGLTVEIVAAETECNVDNNEVSLALFSTEVSDGLATDEQNFAVNIAEHNIAPTIEPIASSNIGYGLHYSLQVQASDQNKGDQLHFSLTLGEDLATINPVTGVFSWTPEAEHLDQSHDFTVQVTDLTGAYVSSSFSLTVTDGIVGPEIISEPQVRAHPGFTYQYQLAVIADEDAQMSYQLLSSPIGMSVDEQGLISWQVPADIEEQVYVMAIRASDQHGNFDAQGFLLAIDEPLAPPIITNEERYLAIEGDHYNTYHYFNDINAIESFSPVLHQAPNGMYVNGYRDPEADYQTEGVLVPIRWPNAQTDYIEGVIHSNHWCGSDSPDWHNLAPQLERTLMIGPDDSDTLGANIIVAALTDSNEDGVVNEADDQVIISSRDYGIMAIDGKTLTERWFQSEVRAPNYALANPIAVADITGDLNREILVLDTYGYLHVMNSDGQLLWTSAEYSSVGIGHSTILADDLNNDGQMEILAGNRVFNSEGNELFTLSLAINVAGDHHAAIADIDQDGVKEIFYQKTVYNHDGSVRHADMGYGRYYVTADVDNDVMLEWVQVFSLNNNNHQVKLFDHDGSLLWTQQVEDITRPIVVDVDYDDQVEIVMTGVVLEADGTVIRNEASDWRYNPWLTDLNQDGALEMVYGTYGSKTLVIADPLTGDQIAFWRRNGGSHRPMIADINSDGDYEILVPYRASGYHYLDVLGSNGGSWSGGGEITDGGGYRHTLDRNGDPHKAINVAVDQLVENNLMIDLHIAGPELTETVDGHQIYADLRNLTPVVYAGELQVQFYHDVLDNDHLLGSTVVNDLDFNEIKRVELDGLIDGFNVPYQRLIAQVVPTVPLAECFTSNNVASSEFVHWSITDSQDLSDQQSFTIRVAKNNRAPSPAQDLPNATAWQNYEAVIELSNPNYPEPETDNTDYFFVYEKPEGMMINDLGEVSWLPTEADVGVHEIRIVTQDQWGIATTYPPTIEIIVEPSGNLPPYFVSEPAIPEGIGIEYDYQVVAIDPEGMAINYSLTESPEGALIDQEGLLTWTPANQGDYPFIIRVEDPQGGFAEQSFTIHVTLDNNQAPIIQSMPDLVGWIVDDLFSYQVIATDADGDDLSYELIQAPIGSTLNGNLLEWLAYDEGVYQFEIKVSDIHGAWSSQWFELHITTEPNVAPHIISIPIYSQDSGDYAYQVVAIDTDPLSYQLPIGPTGMLIDQQGLITWPEESQTDGVHQVKIKVMDDKGGYATQSYSLTIGTGSYGPEIISEPPTSGEVDLLYSYQIIANDDDNQVLFYSLIDAPAGMQIDNEGLISWVPISEGGYQVIVQVSDGDSFVEQFWNITVEPSSFVLGATILVEPQLVDPGEPVNLTITPVNYVGEVTVSATLDGEVITLDDNHQAIITAEQLGTHIIEATITDQNDQAMRESFFIVGDPADTEPPEITINSPEDGGITTGFIDINISVYDDNLTDWVLYYFNSDDQFADASGILAVGNNNIDNETVAELDTSLLRNGVYVIVLEATDINGFKSSVAHSIFLEGDLKLGHFSLAFEDLNLAVAGVPITVTRGYDSRDRDQQLAFGQGWQIGFESLHLSESRVPGLGWYQDIEYYYINPLPLPFPRYCIRPVGEPLVSVRLPDGQLEKFKVQAKLQNPSEGKPECQDLVPPGDFQIEFIPQGDTTSALTTSISLLNVINGNLQVIDEFEAIDPDSYTLTMLDGTVYQLQQGFGVTELITTSGQSLSFDENGIHHSAGLSVSFIKDNEGRITQIEKENGDAIHYSYDQMGNLSTVTDLNGHVTEFNYLADHYLEEIIDPNGIKVARNEYDQEGRLTAHIDADGNRIEYDNDLIAMTSTITDRRGHATINAFDNAGNIIAQTNALGQTTHHQYNGYRLETLRTDALGHSTEWTYDAMGNQLTETDPLGQTTSSSYNNKGELLTQTNALNEVVISNTYVPDNQPQGTGQLSTVTDALGQSTEFHWYTDNNGTTANTGYTDAAGNEYTITPIHEGTNAGLSGEHIDLNGLKTVSTYDADARVISETQILTDENDQIIAEYLTEYQYDAMGNVTKVIDPLGHETISTYTALGKLATQTDAKGNTTEYEYDQRGNEILVRYPDGSEEHKIYDQENNLIESIDRAGRSTKTIYDALNRVSAIIYPDNTPGDDDNPQTSNSYDAAGRLISTTDANGNTTEYLYDQAGRRTHTIDPLGNETVFIYNELGQKVQSIDANGQITTFSYDAAGNLIQTNFANGTHTATSYDSLNRKIAETDLAGLTTEYGYDAAGNLITVTDPLGQQTTYSYDQRGNKLTQTDAKGNTTTWAYDELNRVTSRTLPMGQVESYSYDAVGNRISMTDFNGDTTSYEYNNLNQLILTTYADNSTVANTYTATGQIATITTALGITSFTYDEQDRLKRIDYPAGNYIEYQYDLNGNRSQLKTANQTVDYTFDELNRLETVTDSEGTTTYSYDAVGNRAQQVAANGVVTDYFYDDLNRLIDLQHTHNQNILASFSYELGPNGNRLSLTEGTGRVVEYTYDELYRLTTETITDPINGDHLTSWVYDSTGNRLEQHKDGTVTTYQYDANDRLLSETTDNIITSYNYDDNGNTLTKTIDNQLDTEYSYNHQNQLITVITPQATISYTYHPTGIKRSQQVDGITTEYLIDANRPYAQVIAEQTDQLITYYTYGDDLISQHQDNASYSYGYDGLGSTRILTDDTGVVQNSYAYFAFGEIDYQYGDIANNYLFTGEQYDPNSHFYYLRARFYNPQLGRFQNKDTFPGMAFEPKSLHKYLYTHADPINNIDPTGNFSIGQIVTAQNVNAISNSYAVASIAVQFATGNFAGGAIAIAEEIVYGKLAAFRPVAKQSEKLIKLFGNIWGRGVKLKLGLKANSTTLRHNMQEVLGNAPANHQAHHLVAGTSANAEKARKILQKHDIDINSPSNGVFLPDCSFKGGGGVSTIHCGRHRKAYDDLVVEILSSADAGGKASVISALTNIRLQLLSGELALNAAKRL